MKKFGIILLAIFSLTLVNAKSTKDTKNNVNESTLTLDTTTEYQTIKVATHVPLGLKSAIIDELYYPKKAQLSDIEGQVYMRVTVDTESNVKVIGLSATNPILGNYVKKQLANTFVRKPGCNAGEVFLMKVDFDLIY